MNKVNMILFSLIAGAALVLLTAYKIHEDRPMSEDSIMKYVFDPRHTVEVEAPAFDPELYKELEKISAHYENSKVEISGVINYYEDSYVAAQLKEKQVFSLSLAGKNSLYEIDSLLTLVCNNRCLLIDKREKTLTLFQNDQAAAEDGTFSQGVMLNSIEAYKDYIREIKVNPVGGNLKEMTISFIDEMQDGLENYIILYDARSYAVRKIRMELSEADISDSPDFAGDSVLNDDDEIMLVDSLNNEVSTGFYGKFNRHIYEIIYKSERSISKVKLEINQFIRQINENEFEPVGKYKNYTILF